MSPYLDAPRRSLGDLQRQLRGERIMLLSSQMQYETEGNKAAAEHCLRRIADIEARLRTAERAMGDLARLIGEL